MNIVFVEARCHVSTREIMPCICTCKLLYLPTGYTFEIPSAVWLGISQTDIEGENLVELPNEGHLVGGFLLSARLLFGFLLFEIVHNSLGWRSGVEPLVVCKVEVNLSCDRHLSQAFRHLCLYSPIS